MNMKIATLVDPTSLVSDTASLAEGVIIAPFSNITSSTVLGRNVEINAHTTIGHYITMGIIQLSQQMLQWAGAGC